MSTFQRFGLAKNTQEEVESKEEEFFHVKNDADFLVVRDELHVKTTPNADVKEEYVLGESITQHEKSESHGEHVLVVEDTQILK